MRSTFKPFALLFPFLVFALKVEGLPKPYMELFKNFPPDVRISVESFGGTFRVLLEERTPDGEMLYSITDSGFLSFYAEICAIFSKRPKRVSIKVLLNGKAIPYNPFFELWDKNNRIKLLSFSKLKPVCKKPIVLLKADGISGSKIWVEFGEIKKALFEGGFKYPAYYCY